MPTNRKDFLKGWVEANKMAQPSKALAAKPEKLKLVLQPHVVEGVRWFRLFSDLHTYTVVHT